MKQAPYGSWESPITSDLIVSGTVGLQEIFCDGADTYWIESRPTEGGRSVLVRRDQNGQTTDVTPSSFNVRMRVHEYGGGAYTAVDQVAYCSNFSDNRVYRHKEGEAPIAITSDSELRYADFEFDRRRNRLICVQEDHRGAGEAVNSLVSLAVDGQREPTVLTVGNDFYSSPCLSPSGEQLAWLTWKSASSAQTLVSATIRATHSCSVARLGSDRTRAPHIGRLSDGIRKNTGRPCSAA